MSSRARLSSGASERAGRVGRASIALPVLAGVLAASVAAAGSWIPSLWGDEVASALSARRSWGSLAQMLGNVDAVHGLYYALLHIWTRVFGDSAFALRFPSALAVGVAAAGLVVLVRLIIDSRMLAIIAAVIAAVLPRLTEVGSEARSYALSTACVVWLVVLVIAVARERIRARAGWVLVGLLLTFCAYLFIYTLLLVPVLVVAFALFRARPRRWFRFGFAVGAAMVLVSPLLVAAFLQRSQVAFLAGQDTTSPSALFVDVWFSSPAAAAIGWACILLAVVAAILGWRGARRQRVVDPQQHGRQQLALVAIAWAAVPTVVLVASDPVVHGFSARYVTFTAPAAVLLIALGITALRVRELVTLATAVVVLVAGVTAYLPQRTPNAKNGSDWAQVAALIRSRAQPGDGLVFDETPRWSRRPRLAKGGYPDAFTGLDDATLAIPYDRNISWHDATISVADAVAAGRVRADTVWYVRLDRDPGDGLRVLEGAGYAVVERTRLFSDSVFELRKRSAGSAGGVGGGAGAIGG